MPKPTSVKGRLAYLVMTPLALGRDLGRAGLQFLRQKRSSLRRRPTASAQVTLPEKQSLLVAVTHVVSRDGLTHPQTRATRLDYLCQVLRSIRRSFSHFELEIVINTYRTLHLVEELPPALRRGCRVIEHAGGDPMLIEFAAQDLFLAERERFDWFLFLEDDIVVDDPCFIAKLAEFNHLSLAPRALLLPHRFEINAGRKIYIDRDYENVLWRGPEGSSIEDVINPLTTLSVNSALLGRAIRFAEFTNPHAAFYCLSRDQLEQWARSGRRWYREVLFIGPLESAATGCLFERFDLYKPHPDNKWFLEVRHLGTKYSSFSNRTPAQRESGSNDR